MQKYKYITLLFVVLFLVGCAKDDVVTIGNLRGEKAVYGFGVGGATTRTFINDDGVTISWSNDDKVALWAKPKAGGDYVLSNQTFNTWFVTADNSQAFFTAELDNNAMPTNTTYQYYVTYPTPSSVNGTTCTYTLPAMQDGMMGGGADIMVGEGEGPALAKLYIPKPEEGETSEEDPNYVLDQNRLELKMRHLIHALRFYVPQTKWGFSDGETIERIVFTMPQAVAGTFVADVSANQPALSSPANATNTISLNLNEPIGASTANAEGVINYDYACASILPSTYNGDMTVKVYSQTKATQVTIPINGREMKAGHITPVGLNCTDVVNRPKISFRIANNNLGEQPYKITLTSSDTSTQWKAGDDHVYEYYTGSESSTIAVGGGFDIYCDDVTSIWGKQITVTYESKSAIVSEVISPIPTLSNGTTHNVYLNVPYLLFENFSSVSSFSSNDNYVSLTLSGTQDGIEFLNGWSGGRIGAEAGTAIRLACRRETSADYPARVDSAPLKGLKDGKTVSLSITFDYGMDRKEGGLGSNPKLGQTCYLGYVKNNNNPIASGRNFYTYGLDDQEGEFFTNFYIKETGASYTNIPHKDYNYTLSGCDMTTRLTWLTTNDNKSGTTNGTFWLYIDNIRVKIVQ